MIHSIFTQLLQTLLIVGLAPLLVGWVNQCRAWLQNKSGAGVLQPYRVLHKLFNKDAVLADGASPLFRLAPYVQFGCMALVGTIVPVLAEVFGRQGVSKAHLLPLAIGTSAATIMFTSFSSARAHHLRGGGDLADGFTLKGIGGIHDFLPPVPDFLDPVHGGRGLLGDVDQLTHGDHGPSLTGCPDSLDQRGARHPGFVPGSRRRQRSRRSPG